MDVNKGSNKSDELLASALEGFDYNSAEEEEEKAAVDGQAMEVEGAVQAERKEGDAEPDAKRRKLNGSAPEA